MWPRFVNAALGVWLMAAPAVFGYQHSGAAINERVVGPILVTCAVIASWQVTRPVRWGSVAAGAWLLISPWIFGFEPNVIAHEMSVGAVAVAMGLVRGKTDQRYGGGWRAVWRR